MDYEKKYNEALSWMRELYPRFPGTFKEEIEHYFPELHESEDERIRRDIVAVVEMNEDLTQGRKAEIYAYLEKQKEQKPNIELIQRSWYMEGYHDRDFFMEPKWILKTGEGGPKYEPNPKYGKSLILGPEPCCCSVNKAGLKDAEMQKPAWSEEDIEKMVSARARKSGATNAEMQFYRQGIEDTLKSLRPSWKPSEEQMEALLWCIAHLGGADRRVLAELYEHLKMYCK